MLKFILGLLFLSSSFLAFADFHFSEVYSDGHVWRVDHFLAEDGKLQTKIETKSFTFQSQAQAFADSLKLLNNQKRRFKFVSSEVKATSVWTVKNHWSEEWERKYAEWVEKNFNKSFFTKFNLATDCADVAYALRWIFSRNNGLPAHGTLAGSGLLVTQDSMKAEWVVLATHEEWNKDKRFLAALNWLLDNVYTKTLHKDTFPVKLAANTMKPGLINLMGGHTEIFSKVSYEQNEVPLEVLSSTMPRAVRELFSRPFVDESVTGKEDGGLLRFRWPVKHGGWKLTEKESMPYFSEEQYDENLCEDEKHFSFCLFKKLGMTFKPDLIMQKVQSGLMESLKMREEIVKNGFVYCETHDCSPGTQAWEDWSTPTRDGRLKAAFESAVGLSLDLNQDDAFDDWMKNSKLPSSEMKIFDFYKRMKANFLSSDPRDSLDQRWARTYSAINKTVQGRFKNFQEQRSVLVEKASYCREHKEECRNSRKLFTEYSTLEIDFNLQDLVYRWTAFCSKDTCESQKNFEAELQKVWFQSSIPWDDLEQRNGVIPADAHLIQTRSIDSGGEQFLILDSHKLYDLSKREVIWKEEGGNLGFDKGTKQFYFVKDKKVRFFDEDFKPLDELVITHETAVDFNVTELGSGKYFITAMVSAGELLEPMPYNTAWILDVKDKTVSDSMSVTFSWPGIHENKPFLLTKGTQSHLIYWKGSELIVQKIPAFPGEYISVARLSDDEFLFSFGMEKEGGIFGSEVFHLKNNTYKSVEFYQHDRLEVIRIDGGFLFLNSSYPGRSSLYDRNLMPLWTGLGSPSRLKISKDATLMFRFHNAVFRGYKFSEKGMEETGLKFKNLPMVLGVTPEWISFFDSKNFVVQDFNGEELYQHNFIGVVKCSSISICSGEDLVSEFHYSPLINNQNYDVVLIGRGQGHEMTERLGQVIVRRFDLSEPAPDTEWDSSPRQVSTGQGLYLNSKQILWFP